MNLVEFPLQILLTRHPDWRERAVVVVDRDAPQGVVLWSNERAREGRVLPGLRYAAALSLIPELRAGVVPESDVAAALGTLTGTLRFCTPDVEPSDAEPGLFWLGASGLSLLFPSLRRWAELVRDEVARAGFAGSVVVGFTRFGTAALAKASPPPRVVVVEEAADERTQAEGVPLSRLRLAPDVRDTLARLGVHTLGAFLALPGNGIRTRFGEAAYHLYRLAHGEFETPVQSFPPPEPVTAAVHLDYPEGDLERLMAVIDREIQSLARRVDDRGEVLTGVVIQLEFDDGSRTAERLQPASPTLDLAQIADLVRLRLAGTLAAHAAARGVTTVRLGLDAAAASQRQGELFESKPPRDIAAAARALARVRAELGDGAVVRAVITDGHLPEAHFGWEPVKSLPEARPRAVRTPPLVRRIYAKPVSFSGATRSAEAELIRHIDEGTVRDTFGPYIVSGGWWTREVQREYYFVRTANGRVLWMFYDRRRMGWFIQGEVE